MKTVTVYTTPTCHYCHNVKDFLKTNNINYSEYDVSDNLEKRKEMIAKSGQMGVPVVVIDNDIVVGFNEENLRHLLNI